MASLEPVSPWAAHFSRALGADPKRLHFAAHSHHPWPDVSREAQIAAWDDAARWLDLKWDMAFAGPIAATRAHVARMLSLSDPASVVLAPNTHELVNRLLSAFPTDKPLRILTSDSEFHSLRRTLDRLAEESHVFVERVPQLPIATFGERMRKALREGVHDLVMVSQVFFNSGLEITGLAALVDEAAKRGVTFLLDGYHAFAAVPTDLSAWEDRIYYVAGGYKYAMAGEGVCFMHVPKSCALRPRQTGWFAEYEELAGDGGRHGVSYAPDAQRFAGSTFDPSGAYRFAAVWDHWGKVGVDVPRIHAHVLALKDVFLARMADWPACPLHEAEALNAGPGHAAHFLTFRTPRAGEWHRDLLERGIVTDYRADRLRFGFGLYQGTEMIEALFARWRASP